MPEVASWLKPALFAAVVCLTVGIGIGYVQDTFLRPYTPEYFSAVPSIAGIGIPYVEGIGTAVAGVLLVCIIGSNLTVALLAFSTTLGALAGAFVTLFVEPQFGIWWSTLVPTFVIFATSLLAHRYWNQRRPPIAIEIPAVVTMLVLVGSGAGYLQMGFITPPVGFFPAERVFQPGAAAIGAWFAGITGPISYYWMFRRTISLRVVGFILTVTLGAGCAAALLMGWVSMIITIATLLLTMLVTFLSGDSRR